jgi:ribosome maturation factor RimP
LLRVYIDRVSPVTPRTASSIVEDCERVTRQLQHVLEVENCSTTRGWKCRRPGWIGR